MREVVYKGATRPAMKWGVPLAALLLLLVPTSIATVWLAFGLNWWIGKQGLLVALPGALLVSTGYLWMRLVCAKDDQRLAQMALAIRLSVSNRARGLYGLRSYSAYRARGARRGWRH